MAFFRVSAKDELTSRCPNKIQKKRANPNIATAAFSHAGCSTPTRIANAFQESLRMAKKSKMPSTERFCMATVLIPRSFLLASSQKNAKLLRKICADMAKIVFISVEEVRAFVFASIIAFRSKSRTFSKILPHFRNVSDSLKQFKKFQESFLPFVF